MTTRNLIAFRILSYWGYGGLTVGDLDGRNYEDRKFKWEKNKSYKRTQAVIHAFHLSDIALSSKGEVIDD